MATLPERPFTYSELASLGISRAELRRAVDTGSVRQVLRNVYCPASLPDTLDLRARAAGLVLPTHVVVSDHSAAWLHGIDCLNPADGDVVPDLRVVSRRASRTRRHRLLGGTRTLRDEDLCRIGGLLVTTPLRTACDLACLRGRSAALAALDAFMREFSLSHAELTRMAARYAGRRGVVQLRELIQYASPEAESAGESWTRRAIIDADLPIPKAQVWVTVASGHRYRLDLAYPGLKVAIEYDGEEFHSTPEQRLADEVRRQELRDAGWIVIVVRKDDLSGPALDQWLSELRAAIASRRPQARLAYPKPDPAVRRGLRGR